MSYRKIIISVLCIALLAVMFLSSGQTMLAQESEYQALFINVGKADAILLLLGQERYLVDTGTKDSYEQLEKALSVYEISKLDGVFITHTDKDHVGGLNKLLKSNIQVEMVYAPEIHSEKSLKKHDAYSAAEKQAIPFQWLKAGDVIASGDCSFEVLGPLAVDVENNNNNSLVMNLITPEGNILLTGDMEFSEENQLLDQNLIPEATVLKVAHHGDNDATGIEFVKTVKPKWAIISTNSEEEKDTPDEGVLMLLWAQKAGTAVTEDAQIGILVSLMEGNASVYEIDLP